MSPKKVKKVIDAIREILLSTFSADFPASAHLWNLLTFSIGIIYVSRELIPGVPPMVLAVDHIWGALIVMIMPVMTYGIVKLKYNVIRFASAITFMLIIPLGITSFITDQPLTSAFAFVAAMFYAYAYLGASLDFVRYWNDTNRSVMKSIRKAMKDIS